MKEAGDCRWNESRNRSDPFTYEDTGSLKGERERLAQPARMDIRTQCVHSHSEIVTNQVSLVGKLPETGVVCLLQGPRQVPEPLGP